MGVVVKAASPSADAAPVAAHAIAIAAPPARRRILVIIGSSSWHHDSPASVAEATEAPGNLPRFPDDATSEVVRATARASRGSARASRGGVRSSGVSPAGRERGLDRVLGGED